MKSVTDASPEFFYLASREYDDERFCLVCSNGHQSYSRDDIRVSVARSWTMLMVIIVLTAVVFLGIVAGSCYKMKKNGK